MQPAPPRPTRRPSRSVELSGMNPMHSRPTDDTTKSPRSKWLTARSKMLSPATLANVASSREERTPAQKTADKLLAQKRLATTQSAQSGLFQGQETKKIRQKFLTFTLLLSVLIVTVLAGFGTVASTEAQLQTVRLLGQSLLRSIRGDLSSLIFYTEREVTHFAINFPLNFPLSNDTSHVVTEGTRLMFAQLDSSSGIYEKEKGEGEEEETAVDSPIWQLYFANEQGLVVGVGRASVSASDVMNTSYFECWGGKFGKTVRRTAPAQKCSAAGGWFDDQAGAAGAAGSSSGADTNTIGGTTYSQYEYNARERPWYKLAKKYPNQVVWTRPYRFSSTGNMGLTAALYTQVGVRYNDADRNSQVRIEEGVFAIDITLNNLEIFLQSLAKSAQSLGTFGSFPAELALLQNMSTPKDVIVTSTTSAGVIINGQLNVKGGKHEHLIDIAIKNDQQKKVANNDVAAIQSFRSTPDNIGWFLYATRVRFGGRMSGWDAAVVGILRQSNFLGMLELASRTVYPFIAAILVIIIIPSTSLITRCILRRDTKHQKNNQNNKINKNNKITKSSCLTNCWSSTINAMRLRAHTIVPIIVAVVVSAVVHTLTTCWSEEKIGWEIVLPAFSIVSKGGLSYILHRSWMLTIHHVGGRYNPSTTSKAIMIALGTWIVMSIVVAATVKAVPSMRILQVCSEGLMFLSLNFFVKGDQYTQKDGDIVGKRKPCMLWLMFGGVMIMGLVFTTIEATATWTLSFSVYLIPSLVSIVLLSLGAKCDTPIRRSWPRPQVLIYMMTIALIFVWIVPWLTITATQIVKDSLGDIKVQPVAESNSTSLTAMSVEDIGVLINFGWAFFTIILAIFFEFFIEASATSSMQVGIHFGFILFKSFIETVLFLVVKPLDLGFYALVLLQCFFKILLGLGLKNYIYDKYLSRGLWKENAETHAFKLTGRAMKVNFSIVAPLCSKFGMIVMILLEALQVNVRGDTSQWRPPFTNGFHQLERMSLAAGFFVQVAFHLVSNEIIESMLSLKISKFKRKMATIRMFASGSQNSISIADPNPNDNLKDKHVKRKSSFSSGIATTVSRASALRHSTIKMGGLGVHQILQTSGKKWKWEKHRAKFFEQNWTVFVVWTGYLMSELIGIALSEGRKENKG